MQTINADITIIIAIASGVFALLGSLGSQFIGAYANLRAKRMELVYARKVDAYKELIQNSVAFVDDSQSDEKYLGFYRAVLLTVPVASDEIFDGLISKEKGALHSAIRAHKSKTDEDRTRYLKSCRDGMDNLTISMRKDLKRFAGK